MIRVIKDVNIEVLSFDEKIVISKVKYLNKIEIKNSIINKYFRNLCVNFQSLLIENSVFSSNSKIKEFECLNIYRANFIGKLIIKESIFKGKVNISALHCLKDVVIENCIFEEFVDFGDCWFRNNTTIRNNTFKKGTNLMGNLDKAYKVTFDKTPTIENNIGDLKINILS